MMVEQLPAAAGRHVVVTGGSGFIGTRLVRALCADVSVARVTVLDLNPPPFADPKLASVICDLRQPIDYVPGMPVASCFHLAAACREPGFEWDEYFSNNHLATRHVVAWATVHGVDNIVFTSTAMVFRAGETRQVESDLPNADTAYGISKALAEETLRGWRDASVDRRLRIVRPGVVFGQGAGGNFVNLHRALRKGLFVYIGRRSTVKSAIYVKDLVRLLLTVERDGQQFDTFHGAYPAPTTIEAVCLAFQSVYGWKRWIPVLPFPLALAAALPFQFLNAVGLRNPVHTRRIEKLYHSTHLGVDRLDALGFQHQFSLVEAIADWRDACLPASLY